MALHQSATVCTIFAQPGAASVCHGRGQSGPCQLPPLLALAADGGSALAPTGPH